MPLPKKKTQNKFFRISLYVFSVIGLISIGLTVLGIILIFPARSFLSRSLSSSTQSLSKSNSSGLGYYDAAAPMALGSSSEAQSDIDVSETKPSSSSGSSASQVAYQEGDLTQRKIVKNGSLSLLVKDVDPVVLSIQSLVKNEQGFVSSVQVSEYTKGVKSGSLSIRVPSDRFDATLAAIKQLGMKVENEKVSASDVTEEYIDLKAQLTNLEAQEVSYLKILEKAQTVEETLKVSSYLSETRGKIERMKGKIQYLESQVNMSAISISLTEEADIEILGIKWKPFYVVKKSVRGMLQGFAGYIDSMIGFIFYIPVLAIWVISVAFFLYIVWIICKKVFIKLFLSKRRKKNDMTSNMA